jgi:hypothetical protein
MWRASSSTNMLRPSMASPGIFRTGGAAVFPEASAAAAAAAAASAAVFLYDSSVRLRTNGTMSTRIWPSTATVAAPPVRRDSRGLWKLASDGCAEFPTEAMLNLMSSAWLFLSCCLILLPAIDPPPDEALPERAASCLAAPPALMDTTEGERAAFVPGPPLAPAHPGRFWSAVALIVRVLECSGARYYLSARCRIADSHLPAAKHFRWQPRANVCVMVANPENNVANVILQSLLDTSPSSSSRH